MILQKCQNPHVTLDRAQRHTAKAPTQMPCQQLRSSIKVAFHFVLPLYPADHMADHEALWPPARRAKAIISDLPMKAIVATVRYDPFDDNDVYFEEDGICWIRWIKLETVFHSKRKFYMRYTFGEFSMGVMDAERLQIYYTEECSWISAKKRNRQPGAGRMRYN